mgnify:CR=1 FL=1
MEEASRRYTEAQMAAADLESGSDYLTDRVRSFVITGKLEYLKDFEEEVEVTRRRDLAVEKLEELKAKLLDINKKAFALGRAAAR